MKTRSGIKRGNPKRRAKLFKKQFHSKEFVEWTKKQECATKWHLCHGEIEASHAKSRGAGGTWEDVLPQCSRCHAEMHRVGVVTFARSRGKEPGWLHELASAHKGRWLSECVGSSSSTPRRILVEGDRGG